MEYFNRAINIRVDERNNKNDTAALMVAVSYLCVGRVHYLKEDYEKAMNLVAQSEALFFRLSGATAQFMAQLVLLIPSTDFANFATSVHYAYGNIEFAQKSWAGAKRAYDQSLRIGLANYPIHPITAAAYYSLGCVEYELSNADNAK